MFGAASAGRFSIVVFEPAVSTVAASLAVGFQDAVGAGFTHHALAFQVAHVLGALVALLALACHRFLSCGAVRAGATLRAVYRPLHQLRCHQSRSLH